jgi:DNA-binding MarR family transcriptional regulator
MTPQTVNVLVQGLETDGYLERNLHPAHGRILLAKLTPAGRRALKRGRAVALGVQKQLMAGLGTADRRMLLRQLKAIEKAAAESR